MESITSSRYPLYVGVLAFLLARGYGRNTVIVPGTISVIENTTLRLDCTYRDSITVIPLSCEWTANSMIIALIDPSCSVGNIYPDIYNFECNNATFNTMYIVSTGRSLHNTTFSCSFFVDDSFITGYSTIRIIVPVSEVRMTNPGTDVVTTRENGTVTFICNASAAHPRPNITWFNDSHTPVNFRDDVEITHTVTELSHSDGYLYTVISNLTFYPIKYDNGSRIYCNASNTERQSISSTRKALLNVYYPPDPPTFLLGSNVSLKEVFVIVNNTLMIRCKSSGNPFPAYIWITSQHKEVTGKDLKIENIRRADDGTYSCVAYNEFTTAGKIRHHNTSASIEVTVLYPSDTPTFYYLKNGIEQKIKTLQLKVVEGDSLSVLCNASGNPTPTAVWMHNDADTDTLSIVSAKVQHQTNVTCKSFNVMKDTFGMSRNGTSSKDLPVIVLYPPRNPVIEIKMMPDARAEALNSAAVLEGSDVSLYCYAVGNPSPSYKWIDPISSSHMSTSGELFVRNIQRNQSGPYICVVQNKMERSFGITETGRNSRSIFFDILYKAAIKYFGAANFENNKNIMTVNQGEETRIICKVESNPFSNTTIFFKGRLINETIRSVTATYNLITSTCSDAGRYICKGRNEYNYETYESKELILYVKCLPQPSADQTPEKNVSAALSDSAEFRFHAAPYYDPGITQFRWFKQGNDSRIWLRNGTKTYISSSDIHSVLRIIDVSEADYGIYILVYNNSVGMNNFTFYLQQKDQTVSEEIHQSKGKNLPMIVGIVIAVLVIVGITLGLVIYIRRYKQKTDSNNSDRSYDNICGMSTKSGGNNINSEPVYEGIEPIHERGFVEMKEQTYDKLKPEDSPEIKDPVYTNLKL